MGKDRGEGKRGKLKTGRGTKMGGKGRKLKRKRGKGRRGKGTEKGRRGKRKKREGVKREEE
jgi:hypothetical protein